MKDPEQRLTLEEIIEHPWIQENTQPQPSIVNQWKERFQNVLGSPEEIFEATKPGEPVKSKERRN